MAAMFADTSGWGNLIDISQPFHEVASRIYREKRQGGFRIITSNYVIAELVALLQSPLRLRRGEIIGFINGIKASPYVDAIHVDKMADDEAWSFLSKREDKNWSLVDCSSFILMGKQGISEVLTNDHHFEQAGFVRLLK